MERREVASRRSFISIFFFWIPCTVLTCLEELEVHTMEEQILYTVYLHWPLETVLHSIEYLDDLELGATLVQAKLRRNRGKDVVPRGCRAS